MGQVDWRRGAEWFESQLLDYDVCSNWCNWVMAAGLVGNRTNRFNVVKQSKQYDPEGGKRVGIGAGVWMVVGAKVKGSAPV